jgi:hypothetical protein
VRIRGRRRLDAVLLVGGGVVAAGVSAIGALAYNEERIDRMWVGAAFDADESAAVHEVIDYNFGNASGKHGLLRIIGGLSTSSPLVVSSPDAPDGINSITPTRVSGEDGVEVKIGDAARTVSGRHRYVLDYRLPASSVAREAPAIAWDAVGDAWTIGIEEAIVEVVAPFRFDDVVCQIGRTGSTDRCAIDQPEAGHLRVHVTGLDSGVGVTVRARPGETLAAAPTLPPAPAGGPEDPGAGIAEPAALAAVAAVGGAFATSRLVRRAGRERLGASLVGGAADAAFAVESTSEQRVDAAELADLATTDVAPPEGITAAQGGVILDERVQPNHKVAWLIEAAIQGAIRLEEQDGKTVRIDRLAPGDGTTRSVLDTAFGGRSSIGLGSYDKRFASGWSELGSTLEQWKRSSGLWDPAGDRRMLRVRILGFVLGTLCTIAMGIGAAFAGRHDPKWLVLVALGALGGGVGWAALLRGWELKVRTPMGSGLWLRVESFRRFLHESEAYHAEEAAKRGVLREYTAWAVAVGEIDRWKHAVEASTVIPDSAGLGYVALAPALASSTSHASTAPSSSSSGGGGGGGAGGGGGGGGGGSW